MRIRHATFKDIPRVIEIERASFPFPWSFLSFARELESPFSLFFVLEEEEKVWGYTCYWLVEGEAYLANIALDPQVRNRGWGKYLLSETLKRCAERGAEEIVLEVRVTNHKAIKLYRSFGFKIVGKRPRHYENGEDALIMRMNLKMEVPYDGARYCPDPYGEKR